MDKPRVVEIVETDGRGKGRWELHWEKRVEKEGGLRWAGGVEKETLRRSEQIRGALGHIIEEYDIAHGTPVTLRSGGWTTVAEFLEMGEKATRAEAKGKRIDGPAIVKVRPDGKNEETALNRALLKKLEHQFNRDNIGERQEATWEEVVASIGRRMPKFLEAVRTLSEPRVIMIGTKDETFTFVVGDGCLELPQELEDLGKTREAVDQARSLQYRDIMDGWESIHAQENFGFPPSNEEKGLRRVARIPITLFY